MFGGRQPKLVCLTSKFQRGRQNPAWEVCVCGDGGGGGTNAPLCPNPALLMHSTASACKSDHISHVQLQLHYGLPQHNSLSMHINMHYTSSTTHPTASNVLHTQLTQGTASWQNGTVKIKVLWCHSHLVWLVFEGSIPTCACFRSENFFVTLYIILSSIVLPTQQVGFNFLLRATA